MRGEVGGGGETERRKKIKSHSIENTSRALGGVAAHNNTVFSPARMCQYCAVAVATNSVDKSPVECTGDTSFMVGWGLLLQLPLLYELGVLAHHDTLVLF